MCFWRFTFCLFVCEMLVCCLFLCLDPALGHLMCTFADFVWTDMWTLRAELRSSDVVVFLLVIWKSSVSFTSRLSHFSRIGVRDWETAGELAFCARDGLWPFEGHFFQNPQLRKCCCFHLQHWHVLILFFESGKSDSQPLWFEFVSLPCICLILQWQFFQQSFCLLTFLWCRLHFDQCSMILSCIFAWVDWNVSDLCVLSQLQSVLWIILPEDDKLSLLFERLCLQKFGDCFVSMVFVKIGRSVCVVGIWRFFSCLPCHRLWLLNVRVWFCWSHDDFLFLFFSHPCWHNSNSLPSPWFSICSSKFFCVRCTPQNFHCSLSSHEIEAIKEKMKWKWNEKNEIK